LDEFGILLEMKFDDGKERKFEKYLKLKGVK